MQGGFATAERVLHRAGRDDVVGLQRRTMQEVMERELVARVEALTGRRVEAFMSSVSNERETTIEVFVFAR